ncbi:hypothetical protein D3C75_1271120 [compost metagenome]
MVAVRSVISLAAAPFLVTWYSAGGGISRGWIPLAACCQRGKAHEATDDSLCIAAATLGVSTVLLQLCRLGISDRSSRRRTSLVNSYVEWY